MLFKCIKLKNWKHPSRVPGKMVEPLLNAIPCEALTCPLWVRLKVIRAGNWKNGLNWWVFYFLVAPGCLGICSNAH